MNVFVFTPFWPAVVTLEMPTALAGSSTVVAWNGTGSATVTVFVSTTGVGVGVGVGVLVTLDDDETNARAVSLAAGCGNAAFATIALITMSTAAPPAARVTIVGLPKPRR